MLQNKVHFELKMCFVPQRRGIFRHLTFKKWSEPVSFFTFWLANVLRATAARNFSRTQLPKWLRTCGVLYIFTWKCASRHNGVPFFRIATSKMAPNLRCFVHFYVQMCFAPQRRAIFPDRRLAKWLRSCGVLYIFTYKCASRHSGVPFFRIADLQNGSGTMRCFVHFDVQMCFAPQRRAIFHNSAEQLPPHPPLLRANFANIWNHESLKKHSDSRRSLTFRAHVSSHLTAILLDCCATLLYYLTAVLLCFSTVHIVGS